MTKLPLAIGKGLKGIFDKIRNEKVKKNILLAIPFWFASFITSFVAILYAKGFAFAEQLSSAIFEYKPWLLFIISPVCFITAWWLVKRFAPYSKGSGIPQVMTAVDMTTPGRENLLNKLLSFRIIILKVFSSLIMILGGGAIGREGPTIQISGSIFRKVNEYLPDWWPKVSLKNMIMTGAAAGLAAAFNTPLGGIVFAVEELTKTHISHFKSALFTAVIIAGLTVQSMLGSYLYIGFPDVSELSNYVLFYVMLIAVISGLSGSGMAKIILKIFKWKNTLKKNSHHILYLTSCSLLIASLAFFVHHGATGSGKELMTDALFGEEKHQEWYMPILRVFTPILSFTSGAAGGIFAPGLSAGASIGSVFSGWLKLSDSDTNLMILAGMVAFLTGITRAPFTSAILVLEMTDRNNLILHLMMAGVIASFVSLMIDRLSIYDHLKLQYKNALLKEINPSANKKSEEV
ncbi:MAG: chloride channel protein [Flavobacteriales bacterium]|nr:chloride channel protein [Flavobacteriales bacterium]